MIFFLLTLFLNKESLCLPEEIRVVAIFEDDHLKSAFTEAIDNVNSNQLPSNARIIPLINTFSSTDSLQISNKVCGYIWYGITAIFGPRSTASSHVQAICHDMQIPHLEYTFKYIATERPMMSLNLYPHHSAFSAAMLALLDVLNIQGFALVYDNEEVLIKQQDILKAMDHFDINIYQLEPDNYQSTLEFVQHCGDYSILLDCEASKILSVFKQAQKLGMMTSGYHYIVSSLDLHTIDLEEFQRSGANISSFNLVDLSRLKSMGKPKMTTEEALISDAVEIYARALTALDQRSPISVSSLNCTLLTSWSLGASLVDTMKSSNLDGLSSKITFDNGGFRTDINLQLMELTPAGLKQVGNWNVMQGLQINRTSFKYDGIITKLLINKTILITTIEAVPFVKVNQDSTLNGNSRFDGYCIDVIKILAEKLNFKYNIHLVSDGFYGIYSNGTWNGMIGEIISKKADIAAGPLTLTSHREAHIDFTTGFMQIGIGILFKKPLPINHGLFFVLTPFTPSTWLCIFVSIFVMGVANFLILKFSTLHQEAVSNGETLEVPFSIYNSWWVAIRSFLFQGFHAPSKTVSSRILYIFWWIFIFFVACAYVANMAAFLTIERRRMPINSLEDLLKQQDVKFGTISGGSTSNFFKKTTISLYQRISMAMDAEGSESIVRTIADGVKRVKKGNFAFFMESSMIEYIIDRDCELMQVGGLLDSKSYGFAIARNSPIRDQLSMGILHLQESGQMDLLRKKWFKHPMSPCAKENLQFTVDQIDLINLGGAFILLLSGFLLAFIAIILENHLKSKCNAMPIDKEMIMSSS